MAEPIIKDCSVECGWIIHKWTMAVSGQDTAKAIGKNAIKEMCQDCKDFIKDYKSIVNNSGSKQPADPSPMF